MKKFALTVLAVVSTLAATMPVANAQSTTAGFNVTATLVGKCEIGTFAGDVTFGSVTSFVGPTTSTGSAIASIRCTRGIATPLMVFDSAAPATATSSGPLSTATGAGVLSNGLFYTLTAALGGVTGNIAPLASGGIVPATDAAFRTVTVSGSMPAQAGGTVGAGTQARVMTVSF